MPALTDEQWSWFFWLLHEFVHSPGKTTEEKKALIRRQARSRDRFDDVRAFVQLYLDRDLFRD